jgi:hypothetical protein
VIQSEPVARNALDPGRARGLQTPCGRNRKAGRRAQCIAVATRPVPVYKSHGRASRDALRAGSEGASESYDHDYTGRATSRTDTVPRGAGALISAPANPDCRRAAGPSGRRTDDVDRTHGPHYELDLTSAPSRRWTFGGQRTDERTWRPRDLGAYSRSRLLRAWGQDSADRSLHTAGPESPGNPGRDIRVVLLGPTAVGSGARPEGE